MYEQETQNWQLREKVKHLEKYVTTQMETGDSRSNRFVIVKAGLACMATLFLL